MHGIQDICRQDPSSIDAMLEALQAVADVREALHVCEDAQFKVDFALAAHNAGVLSFSTWMSDAVLREDGESVALECIFLATRCFEGHTDALRSRMKKKTLISFANMVKQLPPISAECFTAREKLCSASRGRLLGGNPGEGPTAGPPAPGPGAQGGAGVPGAGTVVATGTPSGGVPGATVGDPGQQQGQQQQSALFAPDIEEEANSHFQRIYTNKLQIEGVIQMLKGFKTSSNQVH